MAEFLFNRLDTNKDGFLRLDEFKKITELGPAAGKGKVPAQEGQLRPQG